MNATPSAVPPFRAPLPRSELALSELVLPADGNHYGTLFGPNAMALLGKAAFLAATRYSRQSVVMAAARQIDFVAPVPIGSLLNLLAQITRVGRSSMTVRVQASLDTTEAQATEVLRGEFEMVAVDANGRPIALAASSMCAAATVPDPELSLTSIQP